jgi:hypothetical protein
MKILFFLLLPATAIFSDIEPLEDLNLSSVNASYNGKNLMLEGCVSLDHGLGTLLSEEAFLEKETEDIDLPFSIIQLKKDVHIALKNKSTLSCETARLDFLSMTGDLRSDKQVVYTDEVKGENGEPFPLQMMSNSVHLLFNKQNAPPFEYEVKKLTAEDQVVIEYASKFTLLADEATYQKGLTQGLIQAYPKGVSSLAKLSYQGDTVETSFIELDMDKSLLKLKSPNGSLASSLFSEKMDGKVSFSSKTLDWNHEKKTLILHKDITLHEDHFGSLKAEEELVIIQQEVEGVLLVKSIHVKGESILSNRQSTLTSPGLLHINGTQGRITATGTKEKPISYIEEDMCLRSSQAFLEYSEPSYTLSSLLLKGEVTLSSEDRFGIADRLTYSPYTKTVILLANPGNKVLFYDKEQDVSMSADEVHITKNSETRKTEIKGVGHVQFLLSPEENTQLKTTFSIKEEASHEN